MNIKERIIELLFQYEKGKYSNIAINDYFRENDLSFKEKAFITEIFYGIIRKFDLINYTISSYTKNVKQPWVKQLLKISIYQGFFMDSDNSGIVWEAVELTKDKFDDKMGNFVNGVLRNAFRNQADFLEITEKTKPHIFHSYPKWFFNKVKSDYPKDYMKILKSLKETPKLSVRINKLRYSEEEFKVLLENIGAEIHKQVDSVYYVSNGKILNTSEFKSGKITVQDASSYISAKNIGALEGERILDTCSAPGGKSMVMAEEMNNTGEIVALDIHEHKIDLINNNAQNMEIEIINTVLKDATKSNELEGEFDRILVDAPCSGFGVIRKKPEAIYNKKMNNVEELAKLQMSILESAIQKLKVGGTLVYSTCTIAKEENTANVRKFLEKYEDNLEVLETDIPSNVEHVKDKFNGVNIFDDYLDAFYIIKFKKVK